MDIKKKLRTYRWITSIYFNCFWYRDLYSLQLSIRYLWSPESKIEPFFNTKILSALWIVESLWAITSVVLFLIKFKIAFCTISSDPVSSDEVASSSKIIGDFFKTALAIDILCFCPPESFTPFSPISVSYLFSNLSINSSAAANLHASTISLKEASSFAKEMLDFIVSLNKTISFCNIYYGLTRLFNYPNSWRIMSWNYIKISLII